MIVYNVENLNLELKLIIQVDFAHFLMGKRNLLKFRGSLEG